MRCRFINAISEGRWEDFILSEWELDACGWEDFHPHTETNFVLEGELHIESEGKTVILKPGDSARVNPGQLGRYWAPVYARMVTVYGPNPEGLESNSFRHFELCADFLDGLKVRDNGFQDVAMQLEPSSLSIGEGGH
jgi:D-lyxose ketol-isomerase